MPAEARFDAFVSYRRSDGSAVAHWLRRSLQSYRVPRALRQAHGRPLKVYLDTAFERGAADFFEDTIRPNLMASRWLIVMATPDARLRREGSVDWIQREVSEFAAGPNGRNVIAVRGAGEFNDPLPADLIERFPRIEIVDLRGAGRFAFLNPVRAARLASEKIKLIAPLLGLPDEEMPRLRQEEERRQQARLGGTTGAVAGVLTSVAGLSVWALQSQYGAQRTLDDGLFATSSMVVQSARLPAGQAPQVDATRRLLIAQGCDLMDKMRSGIEREVPIAGLVACLLDRGEARERAGETDKAAQAFADAVSAAETRHEKYRRRDAAGALVSASVAVLAFHDRRKEGGPAAAARSEFLKRLAMLQKVHPHTKDFIRREADTLAELGLRASEGRDFKSAVAHYDQAADAMQRLARLSAAEDAAAELHDQAQYHRMSATASLSLEDGGGALERFRKAINAVSEIDDGKASPEALHEAAVCYAYIWELERRAGNAAAAEDARKAALVMTEQVLANPKTGSNTKNLAQQLTKALSQD